MRKSPSIQTESVAEGLLWKKRRPLKHRTDTLTTTAREARPNHSQGDGQGRIPAILEQSDDPCSVQHVCGRRRGWPELVLYVLRAMYPELNSGGAAYHSSGTTVPPLGPKHRPGRMSLFSFRMLYPVNTFFPCCCSCDERKPLRAASIFLLLLLLFASPSLVLPLGRSHDRSLLLEP